MRSDTIRRYEALSKQTGIPTIVLLLISLSITLGIIACCFCCCRALCCKKKQRGLVMSRPPAPNPYPGDNPTSPNIESNSIYPVVAPSPVSYGSNLYPEPATPAYGGTPVYYGPTANETSVYCGVPTTASGHASVYPSLETTQPIHSAVVDISTPQKYTN